MQPESLEDNVFESNYKLMPLKELEHTTQTNIYQ